MWLYTLLDLYKTSRKTKTEVDLLDLYKTNRNCIVKRNDQQKRGD